MFKPIRKKLTLLYTMSFFILLITFIILLYLFISDAIKDTEVEELYAYFKEEQEDFAEDLHEDDEQKEVKYRPEREIFYYLFTNDGELVKGKESLRHFSQTLTDIKLNRPVKSSSHQQLEWEGEHVLLLIEPISHHDVELGYVVIGKNITSQHHLTQRIFFILIGLTVFFTLLLALLSYYLAGKAMVPAHKAFEKQKKFVSDASHELRTPLSIFYSSVELLEKEEKNNLQPFSVEVLEDLKAETHLMKQLLDDLLFLARNDQARWDLNKETVDLSALTRSASRRFARKVPKEITFERTIDDGINVDGDSIRLQELLYILLDNAQIYTEQGSISISLQQKDANAILTVKDTGIGITKEKLPHIFDRFYRADTARQRTGTGLGLSIAKTIVDAHNGTIHVDSDVGVGSTFTISLPVS